MGSRVVPFTEDSITRAAKIVAKGGIIVFPTDTVYGLGCDPFNEDSARRLFRAKGRERKPIPVLCASLGRAEALVDLGEVGRDLAGRHWPGALTIVAPLKVEVPELLHQGSRTLGVRVPDSTLCATLIEACGGWLTGTSANVSGRPSAHTAREAEDQLGGSVDLVLDGGDLNGPESTVVSVCDGGLRVLRKGGVGVKEKR